MKKWSYHEEKMRYVEWILSEVEKRHGITMLEELPREKVPFDIHAADRAKNCCFTGNRSSKLNRSADECKRLLVQAVMDGYEQGFRVFISGMAEGVDRWAAMAVITLRCFYPDIRLVTASPFPARRKILEIDEESMLLSLADQNCVISEGYWSGAYDKRNRWMLEQSSRLIALIDDPKGGSGNTVRYAQKTGVETILL